MTKKSLLSLTLSMLLVATSFAGCGTGNSTSSQSTSSTTSTSSTASTGSTSSGSGKKIKIGFSVQDISNPSWAVMYTHMQQKAKELGTEITLSDCKADPSKQVDSLENFIQGDYDAIIVHAFDAKAVSATVEEAKNKGIKIIAYDTLVETADAYFGLDNYKVGMQIARNAADFIEEKFPDGKCEIGICNYPLNQVCLERAKGIEAGLKEYVPNCPIVAKAKAGYVEEGITVGENFLQAHPNMKVICGIDDAGLLGVYQSVPDAAKSADDFGLFGIDALEEALKLISEGTGFRSTIYLDLNTVGEQMIQSAYDLTQGKTVEKTTYFPMKTITKDNAAEYLKK